MVGEQRVDARERALVARAREALRSLERAKAAQADSAFNGEITPVTVTTRKGDTLIVADEQPGNTFAVVTTHVTTGPPFGS